MSGRSRALLEFRESSCLWMKRACKINDDKSQRGCRSLRGRTETRGYSQFIPIFFLSFFYHLFTPYNVLENVSCCTSLSQTYYCSQTLSLFCANPCLRMWHEVFVTRMMTYFLDLASNHRARNYNFVTRLWVWRAFDFDKPSTLATIRFVGAFGS